MIRGNIRDWYSLPMLHNKKAPESSTSVSPNTAGWEVLLPHKMFRLISSPDTFWAQALMVVTLLFNGHNCVPCDGLVWPNQLQGSRFESCCGLTNHMVAGPNPLTSALDGPFASTPTFRSGWKVHPHCEGGSESTVWVAGSFFTTTLIARVSS